MVEILRKGTAVFVHSINLADKMNTGSYINVHGNHIKEMKNVRENLLLSDMRSGH